jgi:hypothetical protein
MIYTNIHHVTKIEITEIKSNTTQSDRYTVRKIIIHDSNGKAFELVLFAEDAKSLEVTL